NADWDYAAAIWVGECGLVDSGEAKPGADRESDCGGVSAALVDVGKLEAGSHRERGGSRLYGDRKAAGHALPDRIPEEFYGAVGLIDEYGGREVQDDAFYCSVRCWVSANDGLRICEELFISG